MDVFILEMCEEQENKCVAHSSPGLAFQLCLDATLLSSKVQTETYALHKKEVGGHTPQRGSYDNHHSILDRNGGRLASAIFTPLCRHYY